MVPDALMGRAARVAHVHADVGARVMAAAVLAAKEQTAAWVMQHHR